MAVKKNQVAESAVTDNSARYRLRKRYVSEIVPALMSERGYKNINEVPSSKKLR